MGRVSLNTQKTREVDWIVNTIHKMYVFIADFSNNRNT